MPKRQGPKIHDRKPPEGYRDIFGVRDASKGPLVLADCTSIEWPKGWKPEHAVTWRKANGLIRPEKVSGTVSQ